MAQDRTMALLLSMTATAFVSLVIWENIFPDRRDSRILGVLPLRARSFVIARLFAILALFSPRLPATDRDQLDRLWRPRRDDTYAGRVLRRCVRALHHGGGGGGTGLLRDRGDPVRADERRRTIGGAPARGRPADGDHHHGAADADGAAGRDLVRARRIRLAPLGEHRRRPDCCHRCGFCRFTNGSSALGIPGQSIWRVPPACSGSGCLSSRSVSTQRAIAA